MVLLSTPEPAAPTGLAAVPRASAAATPLPPPWSARAQREISTLLATREEARRGGDYEQADSLREQLRVHHGIVTLNDRARSWTDEHGRVGTTDGPDFFEDRGARVRAERAQRRRQKEQARAARLQAERARQQGPGGGEDVDLLQGDGEGGQESGRDPNAYAQWLGSAEGPLLSSEAGRCYPQLAVRCAAAVGRWRGRFPQEVPA
jgi:hypothetical protein